MFQGKYIHTRNGNSSAHKVLQGSFHLFYCDKDCRFSYLVDGLVCVEGY